MKPVKLMRKKMIPIFAKFVAKRGYPNVQHVTFLGAQIASVGILVILMSSPLFISIYHMVVSCGKKIMCCFF